MARKSLTESLESLTEGPTIAQKDAALEEFERVVPIDTDAEVLPIKSLRESARNPRKRFEDLDQMAATMGTAGVLSKLLVRPLDPLKGTYEIVFGHRRFRAAQIAGLKEVPVDIRVLTDTQAAELQLVENSQRADLHPLEEAEGYERLRIDHHYNVAQIAAKVGKSKGWVHARLKLLSLCPEARKSFSDGKIHPTVAVPLARIKSHKHQAEALRTICPKDSEPMSTRYAIEWLQTKFTQTLKGAPFDLKDDMLLPKAGSCMKCPHRSGSTPGLFEDVKGHDTCTNTPCFQEKCTIAWALASESAKAKGAKVLTVSAGKAVFSHNNELAWNSPYVLVGKPAESDPKKRSWKQLVSTLDPEKKPTVVLIPDKHLKARECFVKEEALAAIASSQKWAAKEMKEESSSKPQSGQPEWEKEKAKREARSLVIERLVEKTAAGVKELQLPELRILALGLHRDSANPRMLERRKLDEKSAEGWIVTKADSAELSNFIYEIALANYFGGAFQGYSDEAIAMAKRMGFDLKAEEKAISDLVAVGQEAVAAKKRAEDLMKPRAEEVTDAA